MTYLTTKLKDFVGPSDWNKRPFRLEVNKVQWSVATDRKWVVAMRGGDFEPYEGPIDKVTRITNILESKIPQDKAAVSVPELAKWAQDVTQISREEDTGIAPCNLLGVAVDAVRLAKLLDGLWFQKIAAWNSTTLLGERSIGMTVAGGWVAYLAGLDREPLSLPVFEINLPKKRRKRA